MIVIPPLTDMQSLTWERVDQNVMNLGHQIVSRHLEGYAEITVEQYAIPKKTPVLELWTQPVGNITGVFCDYMMDEEMYRVSLGILESSAWYFDQQPHAYAWYLVLHSYLFGDRQELQTNYEKYQEANEYFKQL